MSSLGVVDQGSGSVSSRFPLALIMVANYVGIQIHPRVPGRSFKTHCSWMEVMMGLLMTVAKADGLRLAPVW